MIFIQLSFDSLKHTLTFDVSPWLLGVIATLLIVGVVIRYYFRRYDLVKLEIALGNIGKVELKPNTIDLQIAHRIWTELITRKAAIPINPNNDVVIEVYDSWYALFTQVRKLVGDLPAGLIRRKKSTREIVRIATLTLNEGLRPHLTKWQARFRSWYDANRDRLKELSPQELQKEFPEFRELTSDMELVNTNLIKYARELKKLLGG